MTTSTSTLRFEPQTVDSAPEGSRESLQGVKTSFGFIPNLLGTLGNSPAALDAYLELDAAFKNTGFSSREGQLIALAASVENECGYCIAAHSTVLKGLKLDAETVAAVRSGTPLADDKLDALVNLVRQLVRDRGRVDEVLLNNFLAAGYEQTQVLELLVGIALKTFSNYLDHISPVEIDAAFAGEK